MFLVLVRWSCSHLAKHHLNHIHLHL